MNKWYKYSLKCFDNDGSTDSGFYFGDSESYKREIDVMLLNHPFAQLRCGYCLEIEEKQPTTAEAEGYREYLLKKMLEIQFLIGEIKTENLPD